MSRLVLVALPFLIESSTMRFLLATACLIFTTLPAWAQTSPTEEFLNLRGEFQQAIKAYQTQLQEDYLKEVEKARTEQNAAQQALAQAKTEQDKQEANERLQQAKRFPAMKPITLADGPGKQFTSRFLKFAKDHPESANAIDALMMTLRTSGGQWGHASPDYEEAITILKDKFTQSPQIKNYLRELPLYNDDSLNRMLNDIIEKHPDPKVQARACKIFAEAREALVKNFRTIESDPAKRQTLEQMASPALVAKILSRLDESEADGKRLRALFADRFAKVLPDLSIGKELPDTVSQDLDGKPVKVSDLRGKVVVIDVWATWCGPCLAMIPHQREMVAKLKDKPFVLVSISADESREVLKAYLAKEPLPWTHWFNGADGGIIEDWEISAFPTILVLDSKGIIRFKNVQGNQLEAAVNELLGELK